MPTLSTFEGFKVACLLLYSRIDRWFVGRSRRDTDGSRLIVPRKHVLKNCARMENWSDRISRSDVRERMSVRGRKILNYGRPLTVLYCTFDWFAPPFKGPIESFRRNSFCRACDIFYTCYCTSSSRERTCTGYLYLEVSCISALFFTCVFKTGAFLILVALTNFFVKIFLALILGHFFKNLEFYQIFIWCVVWQSYNVTCFFFYKFRRIQWDEDNK